MFIDWERREVHAKLVYYGPPLGGKTTNVQEIHRRLPSNVRSDLVSIKTKQDRTLFFDFMQMELNRIHGLKPKFKLYTVPGQVYYKATRTLALEHMDGVIFVADSSINRLPANRTSLDEIEEYLEKTEKRFHDFPFVLQCNKQDLRHAVEPDLIARFLGLESAVTIPAVAQDGIGTVESLKSLIGQVIKTLRKAH